MKFVSVTYVNESMVKLSTIKDGHAPVKSKKTADDALVILLLPIFTVFTVKVLVTVPSCLNIAAAVIVD